MKTIFWDLRIKRGLTMKQVGEAIGVGESCISLYENGKRSVKNIYIDRYAKLFKISPSTLLKAQFENIDYEQVANDEM